MIWSRSPLVGGMHELLAHGDTVLMEEERMKVDTSIGEAIISTLQVDWGEGMAQSIRTTWSIII